MKVIVKVIVKVIIKVMIKVMTKVMIKVQQLTAIKWLYDDYYTAAGDNENETNK